MSEQPADFITPETASETLDALEVRVEIAREQLRIVKKALRHMTGASLDSRRVLALRASLDSVRGEAAVATNAADDLRRRAANPREGGES